MAWRPPTHKAVGTLPWQWPAKLVIATGRLDGCDGPSEDLKIFVHNGVPISLSTFFIYVATDNVWYRASGSDGDSEPLGRRSMADVFVEQFRFDQQGDPVSGQCGKFFRFDLV